MAKKYANMVSAHILHTLVNLMRASIYKDYLFLFEEVENITKEVEIMKKNLAFGLTLRFVDFIFRL